MKPDETQNRMQSEMTNEAGTLLEIRNLKVRFTARKKVLTAVDGVSMSIRPGEIVGVVGESGSGKSVMSQSILRLREYDSDVRYEGQVLFEGQDLLKASQAEMRGIRGNRIAVIFQDPMTSLSPVHTVGRQLSEVLVLHKKMTKQRAKERCRELLRLTGIPNPEDCMRKYPYELSGGMQQRVMIAMALSCEPQRHHGFDCGAGRRRHHHRNLAFRHGVAGERCSFLTRRCRLDKIRCSLANLPLIVR